jgi:hypothetical protein
MTAGMANDCHPDLRPPAPGCSAIPSISCKRYCMHGHRALPGTVAVSFDDRYAVQPCRLRWDMEKVLPQGERASQDIICKIPDQYVANNCP